MLRKDERAMLLEDLQKKIKSVERAIRDRNEGRLPERPKSIVEQIKELLDKQTNAGSGDRGGIM
jgi:hypothetical protein